MIRDTKVAESQGLQEQLQAAASILPNSSRGSGAGESQGSTLAALHQAARPLLQAAIGIWQHCKPLKYLTADLQRPSGSASLTCFATKSTACHTQSRRAGATKLTS